MADRHSKQTGLVPAAAYLRMSSDKQEASIADQREAVKQYAAANGYKIIREYVDEGRPGWKDDRKAFQQLINDAECREFVAILCWDQDRFSRFPVLEANHYWFLLDRAGVHISTVAQGRLEFASLAGWLTASIAQHGKSEYCRDLARNTTRGLRKRKLAGQWVGKAPLGYSRDESGKLILGPPEEIDLVRTIFRMRAEGSGYLYIAKWLNKSGVPTPYGRLWSNNAVRHVLRRDAYLGHVVIGKHSRARYERLTDGVVTIKNAHPALIDQRTWNEVRALEGKTRQAHWKGDGEGAPLAGLLYCGRCGSPMYSIRYRDQWAYYLCGTKQKTGGCGHCSVNQQAMLDLVAAKIRETVLLGSRDRLERAIAAELERRAGRKAGDDSDAIRRQVATLDSKIGNATERLVTVAKSLVPTVEAKLLDLQRQRLALLDRLDTIEPNSPAQSPQTIADAIWRLDALLRNGRPSVVRNALSRVVGRLVIEFEPVPGERKQRLFRPIGGRMEFTTEGQHSETSSC